MAAAMTASIAGWPSGEPSLEWESLLFSEIGDLLGEDELQLDVENETYESNLGDLDFDLDLMSWDSDAWDVTKQTPAVTECKAEPLSPTASTDSVPSPLPVDSPVQHVPEDVEFGTNSHLSTASLYDKCSSKSPLPLEQTKKSLPKTTRCSANGSSMTLKRSNPAAPKPLIQPKPLLHAFCETQPNHQAKAIVIPALPTLLTLPKQPQVVTIQPAPSKGQPLMLSQPAVVHLQTSGILPASNPAIAVNGGVKPLTGHTIRVLPQSAAKSLTSGNLSEAKPVLHTTSSNTNMDNQNLKGSPPKRRAFCVMVLLAFVMLNYDRLSGFEWGPDSAEHLARTSYQSRHLLEFSASRPQETDGKNNDGYKPSVSDNKALMVVTEEPIIYVPPRPCQPFINRTESLRLSHELRGWVHRHEAERTRSRRLSNNQQQKEQTVQSSSGKNSELMALSYTDNSVGRNSGSELQVYYASPRNYQDFFDAIHRRGDTFYVVSFRRDHLLLPATTHNKTRRPKMSIVLPAINISEKIINGQDYEVMMQIDTEVLDTRILHIKSSSIPPYLREQQRNHTTSFYHSPPTVPEAASAVRTISESPQ
ncbi:cyclic AMP-dependent transcription factor ATF-6 alpha isoform X3 [Pseudonaja textilis]|uniref:cyclic AMP-dependent transcription factor ATF-6 alpha isoform X3 n=1 Tax=Pseudonaja textilis TaxID=8673 RepID=UPI000EAA5183|nr:cyclic AMP-dependent transcription factor ATF-6 alpha isoform X3 [Pseudonaja textilis]